MNAPDQDRAGQDRGNEDRPGQERRDQDRTGQDRTDQDRAGARRRQPAQGRGWPVRSVSASVSRQSPPNSSTWTAGSVNAARETYCSGSVRPSTSAPAGAHCGPASRATRPPKLSTAKPPSSGPTAAAPLVPCAQNPPASSIGSPEVPTGTTAAPWAKKPALAKPSPACAPPNAASETGMGSDPRWASQYPACR